MFYRGQKSLTININLQTTKTAKIYFKRCHFLTTFLQQVQQNWNKNIIIARFLSFLFTKLVNWAFLVSKTLFKLSDWKMKYIFLIFFNSQLWEVKIARSEPKFSLVLPKSSSKHGVVELSGCCMIAWLLIHFTTRVKSADFPGRQILINAKSRTPGSLTLSCSIVLFFIIKTLTHSAAAYIAEIECFGCQKSSQHLVWCEKHSLPWR